MNNINVRRNMPSQGEAVVRNVEGVVCAVVNRIGTDVPQAPISTPSEQKMVRCVVSGILGASSHPEKETFFDRFIATDVFGKRAEEVLKTEEHTRRVIALTVFRLGELLETLRPPKTAEEAQRLRAFVGGYAAWLQGNGFEYPHGLNEEPEEART